MQGISDFAVVHDSFGVHAHHVPRLAQSIREAFVEMYLDRNALEEFYENVEGVLPDLERPPTQGTLDIKEVLESKYFFS